MNAKWKYVAGFLGLLGITLSLNTTGHAYVTYASWPSSPVLFYANPGNADTDATSAENALKSAMDGWNTQSGTPFRFTYVGRVNDTTTSNDHRNVIIFRNASNGSAIASTYSWYSGSSLVDADIVFWDGSFTFFAGAQPCSGGHYIEDVATHELGHALGLLHSTVGDATMYPSVSQCSQELRSLAPDDIAGAQSLYGSQRTTTNTAPTVTINTPSNNASVAQGSAIAFSGSGSDAEDGNVTSSLTWRSNVSGQIGTGGSFSAVLPSGTHVITATGTDSKGLSSSRSVTITVAGAPPPSNTAPNVTLSSPSAGGSFTDSNQIAFVASANDVEDGNLTAGIVWRSNVSGQIGTGGSFSRTLPAGTHVITASVADSGALTSSRQVTITVTATAPPSNGSTLSAKGYKVKGQNKVDLMWNGISGTDSVDVYRNGAKVLSTANDGTETDPVNTKGNGTFKYRVCPAGSSACTNEVSVSF